MNLSEWLENEDLKQTVKSLEQLVPRPLHTAVIFGSFLARSIDFLSLDHRSEIKMKSLPHYPLPSVAGQEKSLISGTIKNKLVLLFSGRIHYYEGYRLLETVLPVIISKKLGAKQIIITNSAGGLNPEFTIDDIMLIENHLNLMGDNPLFGYSYDRRHDYFINLAQPYSQSLLSAADLAARQIGLRPKHGVYAGVRGPVLETAAEANMLRIIGADAVGMSTVAETIMANYLNLDVLGISHIRNLVSGQETSFSHLEGNKKETKVGKMLSNLIEKVIEDS
ncbi:MAG: purine-nucleoside phosphorylase [Actinomycetia bacterium]|nr:purine-nucleoside phosphorylase [Actinomycetes bacterium]